MRAEQNVLSSWWARSLTGKNCTIEEEAKPEHLRGILKKIYSGQRATLGSTRIGRTLEKGYLAGRREERPSNKKGGVDLMGFWPSKGSTTKVGR